MSLHGNIFWHLATQGETSVRTARSLAEERAAERCRDLRGLIRLLASMARCWPVEDGGSKGGEPNSTTTTGADGSAVRWSIPCMMLLCGYTTQPGSLAWNPIHLARMHPVCQPASHE